MVWLMIRNDLLTIWSVVVAVHIHGSDRSNLIADIVERSRDGASAHTVGVSGGHSD